MRVYVSLIYDFILGICQNANNACVVKIDLAMIFNRLIFQQ